MSDNEFQTPRVHLTILLIAQALGAVCPIHPGLTPLLLCMGVASGGPAVRT